MTDVRLAGRCALALAALMLGGCLPLMPHPEMGSRTNVAGAVPGFIRAGESTRADVLHALGEPDACADDESWMMYSSAYSKGGMLLSGGGTGGGTLERMRYRRLLVQFDAGGRVTKAFTESADCWVAWGSANDPTLPLKPCMDRSGRDMPTRHGLAPLRE